MEHVKQTLIPRTKIDSKGKIHYSESFQAWNTLKIKKEMFAEFPQLKEKRSKFSYKLTYCRTKEELEKEINQITKGKNNGTPLLLRIFKEE